MILMQGNNSFFNFANKKLWVVALLILAAFVAAILAYSKQPKYDGPTGTAVNFLKLVQSNKPDESYKLADESFKNATSIEGWRITVNRIGSNLKGKILTTSSKDETNPITGEKVKVVSIKVETKSGNYNVTCELTSKDSFYLIRYFNSQLES